MEDEEIVDQMLGVLAQDAPFRESFFPAASDGWIFNHPDDDLPGRADDDMPTRCFVLAVYRTFHGLIYRDPEIAWEEELRHILVVIDYMLVADDQEYFWHLHKQPFVGRGPLDGAWELLSYLAKVAINKRGGPTPMIHASFIELVKEVGIDVDRQDPSTFQEE